MAADEPVPKHPPELPQRAERVFEALTERSRAAGDLYVGVIRVLADDANPARLRQAAYAAREIIQELDNEAGVVAGPGLKQRVKHLDELWRAENATDASQPGDDPLQGFCGHLEEFFTKYREEYRDRLERARATIRALDPAAQVSPPAVETPRAEALGQFRDDFNRSLHGSRSAGHTFERRLRAFEEFVLDWFQPRTFDDFNELDALIEGGPPDD